MEILSNQIPESVRIEISENTDKHQPLKKVLVIGFLRRDTCEVLKGLFEAIGENVLNAEHARQTKFVLIEENRKLLSMILAVAVFNYKAEYSKKVFRFIERNTTPDELLALIYVVKKQMSLFIAHHYIDDTNRSKMNFFLQSDIDKKMEDARQAFERSNQQTNETIKWLSDQSKKEWEELKRNINEGSKHCTHLKITHCES